MREGDVVKRKTLLREVYQAIRLWPKAGRPWTRKMLVSANVAALTRSFVVAPTGFEPVFEARSRRRAARSDPCLLHRPRLVRFLDLGSRPMINQSSVTPAYRATASRYSIGGLIRALSYLLTAFCGAFSAFPKSTWLTGPRVSRSRRAIASQSTNALGLWLLLGMLDKNILIAHITFCGSQPVPLSKTPRRRASAVSDFGRRAPSNATQRAALRRRPRQPYTMPAPLRRGESIPLCRPRGHDRPPTSDRHDRPH